MMIDDRITEALHDVPTAAQRPLADIEAIGHTRKRRRAAAVGMGVIAAAGLLAMPANSLLSGGDPDEVAATAPEPPPCPTAPWEIGPEGNEDWDFLLSPDELPAELRLLWPESTAPAPTRAEASVATAIVPLDDYFASCSITQHEATLIYLDDNEVTTRIWLQYTSIPYEHPPARGDEPSPIQRVIPAGDREIGLWRGEPGKDVLHAGWGDDDESWDVVTKHPLSDEELVELASTAKFTDGTIDLSGWSMLEELPKGNDAGHLIQTSIQAVEPVRHSFDLALSEVGGSLSIRTSSEDLLVNARPGHRLIDIDGQPALLEQQPAEDSHPGSVALMWKPSSDVLATVHADAGNEELILDIARSLEPVPADDTRLTDVWDDSMAQSWNE